MPATTALSKPRAKNRRWRRLREEAPNYLFILPQFILFIAFLAWPVVRGIEISLNDWKIMGVTQRFIGAAATPNCSKIQTGGERCATVLYSPAWSCQSISCWH